MKNIKVLGLAIAVSIVAAPAFAGETYVRNESIDSWGHTKTDLDINSTTRSNRKEVYGSFANKIYTDSDLSVEGGAYGKPLEISDEYSVHTAGSLLLGNFKEKSYTNVKGWINSYSEFDSNSHETSSGVR